MARSPVATEQDERGRRDGNPLESLDERVVLHTGEPLLLDGCHQISDLIRSVRSWTATAGSPRRRTAPRPGRGREASPGPRSPARS